MISSTEGIGEGRGEGEAFGVNDGRAVGAGDGSEMGIDVGIDDGEEVGEEVGLSDGLDVRETEGFGDGSLLGSDDGSLLGSEDGSETGTLSLLPATFILFELSWFKTTSSFLQACRMVNIFDCRCVGICVGVPMKHDLPCPDIIQTSF